MGNQAIPEQKWISYSRRKKRYSKEDSLRDSRIRKASHMSDMSDEQLRNETNRINLETNYKNAVAVRYAKNGESFGSLGKEKFKRLFLPLRLVLLLGLQLALPSF